MWFANNLDHKNLLLTGSFNFTNMAQEQNQENVIITDNHDITTSYLNQFLNLKQQTVPINKFIKQQKFKVA